MKKIQVSSVKELYAALAKSKGGEIIELAEGTYDKIGIWKGLGCNIDFDVPVTIRSANPNNPAVVRELAVNGASGLVFDNINFDYEAPVGRTVKDRPYEISNSENITIRNSVFDGDLADGVSDRADGYGTGVALTIRNNSNIAIENNEFFDWYKGVGFGETTGAVFRGNDIHSIRSDGLTMTKVVGGVIEDNYIHDFERNLEAGDHSDMIQFWTYKTDYPSTDIVIRGNRLDIGDGDHSQGIFMGNEAVRFLPKDEQASMFYQRITIEDNLIVNAHSNGLVLGQANDVSIKGNILLHSDGGSPRDAGHLELPVIRVEDASTGVVIEGNVAYRWPDGQGKKDWTVADNTIVQDLKPKDQGYYKEAEDLLIGTAWADDGMPGIDPEGRKGDAPEPSFPSGGGVPSDGLMPIYDVSEGYTADFAALAGHHLQPIRGKVSYDTTSDSLDFSGDKGAVILGKLHKYRETDELTFTMKYTMGETASIGQLVDNHKRLAVAIEDGAMIVRVATQEDGVKRYKIEGVDTTAGSEHRLTVALDRVDDHLQVLLDGDIILDDTDTDFVSRDGIRDWGWTLGNRWHDSFDGSIEDFSLTDQAHFMPQLHSEVYGV